MDLIDIVQHISIIELQNYVWCKSWDYLGEGTENMEQRISRCRAKSRLCNAFLTLDVYGRGVVPLIDLRQTVET